MRRRIPISLICSLLALSAYAQGQQMPRIEAVDDYFAEAGAFSFSFLRYRWRGLTLSYQTFRLNGLPLNSLIDGTPPFGAMGSLSSVAATSRISNTLFFDYSDAPIGIAGGQSFAIDPASEPQQGYATTAISNRTYTYRLSAGYNLPDRNGWAIVADASRRWGRSLSIDGVAADAWGIFLAASKRIDRRNILQITAIYNPSERLMPSSSTAEAFELTGNNLYNPAWGVQDGRQRSVNVRRSNEPIVMLNHTFDTEDGLKITSGMYVRFGENSYSGLNWQGAPNPRPDYYRYMPSAAKSDDEAQVIRDMWRSDVNVRQINFSELRRINQIEPGRAKYILEERVTQPLAIVAASRIVGHSFSAGLTLGYESTRNFKRINSLFGGHYWLDVDSFVEQDDDIKEKNQNNVLAPNAHVAVGDRFGYHYSMTALQAVIDGAYVHNWGNFHLTAAASVSLRSLQREGYYEKENFPLGDSYGASKGVLGVDWSLRAEGEYRLATRLSVGVVVALNSASPSARQQFISPRYRNALTPNIGNSTTAAVEARASMATDVLRIGGSLYYYHVDNYGSVRNVYDDMQHVYVHYVTRNAAMAHYGVEASAEILLIDPLWLNVAMSLANNVYTNNPTADAYVESTDKQFIAGETLLYKDLHVGGAPQTLGIISLNYRPYGWTVRLSAVVFAGGYVALSPLRHTARAALAAASPLALETMRTQEKLPAGVSIDLFGGYTHRFAGGSSLGIYAGVNNLLSDPNFVASGSQSDRFFASANTITPQPSRYYYALPVNFFLNITYRF